MIARATELADRLMTFVGETSTLVQLMIVALAMLAARIVAWRLTPRVEARVRAIPNPDHNLLRVLIVLMRRLDWVMFTLFGSFSYLLMRVFSWPGSEYLVFTSLMLALAWLGLAIASQAIRNRALGKLIRVLVWTYVALILFGISDETSLLLDAAGFSVGNFRVSLLLIVKMFVFLGLLLWAAIGLGNFFEKRLQSSEDLTPSLGVLLGKVLKISLIVTAVLVGLSGLGINLTVFTVFSGAIGVGLGFGLQKVVSNFISGIIILMDRSIKPGDTISLGETFGWIRELRARFVSVVTRDGREYLIPNEDFITHEVINWSFSDALVRLDVKFGVSYDSDPHEVTRLAKQAASGVDRVYSAKPPVCWMTEFGDSSLNFVLRFWITDPRDGLTNVRGKVLLALWDVFKENGVNIPFPHREVIMKTPVEVSGAAPTRPPD
ncbi:mechanosensitive ion channel family protein [Elongatibacter sediminis]|uniref:Mechanosensitive ion channel domain-containing protein n=1 Tax=Elongatibacter sediminis TaxID=3119006 RepID=A0AAW9REU2_9GAMM